MEENIKVYAQVDSNNVITNVNSSIFLTDDKGWVQIDEGTGDKYSHAQGNYFTIDGKKPLMDEKFRYNYKLVDGKPVELTEDEKEKLFPAKAPELSEVDMLKNYVVDLQCQLDRK